MKIRFLILALCLCFGLAACSSDDSDSKDKDQDKTEAQDSKGDKKDKEDAKEDKKPVTPICPQVAIVAQLDTIRDYGTEKPDPAELVAQAKLLKVQGTCSYEEDPDGIDVAFDLNMIAQRGPRLGGLNVSFPFFTAVLDPSGKILNKEPMTTSFKFSSETMIARTAESLHVFVPLAKAKQSDGPDYRVLIGFQLTGDQYQALNTTP